MDAVIRPFWLLPLRKKNPTKIRFLQVIKNRRSEKNQQKPIVAKFV